MGFSEKIDKILKFNSIGVRSVAGLEDYLGCGRGAINDFYKEDREPGRKTLKRIMEMPDLNEHWWKTGLGDVFILSNKAEEPESAYESQRKLIEHLSVTNAHLFSLTDDLRDRNRILEARIKDLEKELENCK